MLWIIENDAFSKGDILLDTLKKNDKHFIVWKDELWITKDYKKISNECIFHGSLDNAYKLKNEMNWNPGSLCDEIGFSYSYVYANYKDFILNKNCIFTTIKDLMENKLLLDKLCKSSSKFFARPNSPLKEFSGRILDKNNLLLAHFDYGFYHEDMNLQIVLSEVKDITKEYRFVCVNNKIISGCEYIANGREGKVILDKINKVWDYAQKIADCKKQKDFAYIIDICESEEKLFLVEMNPFSGADLYVCEADKIINAIEGYCTL